MGGTRGGGKSTETEHIEGVDTSGSSSGRGRFRGSGFGVWGSGFRVRVSGFGIVRVSEANLDQRHRAMQTDADVRFPISFVKTCPPAPPRLNGKASEQLQPPPHPTLPHTAPECRVNATGMLVNNTGHSRSRQ